MRVLAVRLAEVNVGVFGRGRDVDVLSARFVLDLDARVAARVDHVLRVVRLGDRARVGHVGDGACDHRAIGVAAQEDEQHLGAFAEREVEPLGVARVRLEHTNPRARAAFVEVALVEEEFYVITTVLVDLRIIAVRGPVDHRAFDAVDARPRGAPRGPILRVGRDRVDLDHINLLGQKARHLLELGRRRALIAHVLSDGGEVTRVVRGPRVLIDLEGVPGPEIPRAPFAGDDGLGREERARRHLGEPRALGRREEARAVVDDGAARGRDVGLARQIERGLEVIVVLELDRFGQRAHGRRERVERLARGDVVAEDRVIRHRRLAERLVRGLVVGDDELLFVVALLEEIRDALALHPPREEGKVALFVLADVLFGRVTGAQLDGVVVAREARVFERLVEDVAHALVGEDAAVPALGQKPDLGHEDELVEAARIRQNEHQLEPHEDAVPAERVRPVMAIERERRALPDGRAHLEVSAVRVVEGDEHVERIELAQRLTAPEADDPEARGQRVRCKRDDVVHDRSSRRGALVRRARLRERSRIGRTCNYPLIGRPADAESRPTMARSQSRLSSRSASWVSCNVSLSLRSPSL